MANCPTCEHHRCGTNARSSCVHPLVKNPDKWKKISAIGDKSAIARGWFIWPVNFDPKWLISCKGFLAKPQKIIINISGS